MTTHKISDKVVCHEDSRYFSATFESEVIVAQVEVSQPGVCL